MLHHIVQGICRPGLFFFWLESGDQANMLSMCLSERGSTGWTMIRRERSRYEEIKGGLTCCSFFGKHIILHIISKLAILSGLES